MKLKNATPPLGAGGRPALTFLNSHLYLPESWLQAYINALNSHSCSYVFLNYIIRVFESWPLHSNLQILKLFTTNDPYLRVIVSFGVHDISPLLSGIILTGKLIDSIHKLTGENIEQVLQHFVNEITLLFERDGCCSNSFCDGFSLTT